MYAERCLLQRLVLCNDESVSIKCAKTEAVEKNKRLTLDSRKIPRPYRVPNAEYVRIRSYKLPARDVSRAHALHKCLPRVWSYRGFLAPRGTVGCILLGQTEP